MHIAQSLEKLLVAAFHPEHLFVEDESSNHAVPEGSETHFRVCVVSAVFEGESLVKRHRLVHQVVASLMGSPIHALALELLTPKEWQQNPSRVQSPPCSKKL